MLAEGIYWLLDQDKSITEADRAHWDRFLAHRRQFIERVLQMVQQDASLERADKARRIEALKGSLGRLALITPQLCEDYLRAWVADRQSWQQHLHNLHRDQLAGLATRERLHQAIALLSRPDATRLSYQIGAHGDTELAVAGRVRADVGASVSRSAGQHPPAGTVAGRPVLTGCTACRRSGFRTPPGGWPWRTSRCPPGAPRPAWAGWAANSPCPSAGTPRR